MRTSDRSSPRSRRSGQHHGSIAGAALWLILSGPLCRQAYPQTAILQVRILEGDGSVHAPGSRPARSLLIEVTDETGTPVTGATASFRLPDEGPTGVFPNGLRTDLALTDAQGRASLRGLQFNRSPGEFQIRITVAKDNARAGTVSTQYIGENKMANAPRSPRVANPPKTGIVQTRAGNSTRKWLALGVAVAAAAAGGGIAARGHGSAAPAILAPAAITSPVPLSIGAPTITIGKP